MAFKATTENTVSFVWDFNEGRTNALRHSVPANTLLNREIFFDCPATGAIILSTKQPLKVKASLRNTLFSSNSLLLFTSGAERYSGSPANRLEDTTFSGSTATPGISIIYRVIRTGTEGCLFDTALAPAVVYPYPVGNAREDKTILVANPVTLNLTVANDVKSIILQPPTELSCATWKNSIANPKQTTTYTISVSNQGGYLTKDEINVFVACREGDLFIPNAFSRNGDGINFVLYARGKGSLEGLTAGRSA